MECRRECVLPISTPIIANEALVNDYQLSVISHYVHSLNYYFIETEFSNDSGTWRHVCKVFREIILMTDSSMN